MDEESINALLRDLQRSSGDIYPPYEEMRDLILRSRKAIASLSADLRLVENWKNEGEELLGKKNGALWAVAEWWGARPWR